MSIEFRKKTIDFWKRQRGFLAGRTGAACKPRSPRTDLDANATEIRRVRLERAKRELARGDRRLTDLAREAGFGEAVRMCEVFHRELGVTPSGYRQQLQLTNG